LIDLLREAGLKADRQARLIASLGRFKARAAVPTVVAMLTNPDPKVRAAAAEALGKIGDTDATPKVRPLLKDDSLDVRKAAIAAVAALKDRESIPALILAAEAEPTHYEATIALAAMEGQYAIGAVEALKSAATDRSKSADERARALAYLAQAHRKTPPWNGSWWGTRPTQGKPPAKSVAWEGTPVVLGAVRDALADPDIPVRLAAVAAVKEENDREALPKLRERFAAEPDEKVRREIAAVFGAMDDKAALPLLIAALRHATVPESVREASLVSIEEIGTDAAIAALVDLLREAGLKADRQARLIASLGRFKARAAVPTVVAMLTNPDPKVRATAAEALGKIGDTDATPKVRPLLKDDSLDVRKAAITAVAALKDRESIPALILAAESEPTHYEATIALAAMPDIRALHVHLRGLSHKSQDVRKASTSALAAIRDEARPILERLAGRKELPPSALPELRKIYGAIRPIAEWKVVGPFKKNERPPFAMNRPVDATKPINHEGKPLAWKTAKAKDPEGQIDLNGLYSDGSDKSAFGYAEVSSPTARPARMAVGSDDTLQVWLNGKSVFRHDSDRGFTAAEDEFDVNLTKGTNRIVIRCGNTGGPWAFSVGVSSTESDHAFLQGPASGGFDPDKFRAEAIKGKGKAERGKA
ncbi:MAG TPA: HEAT repeat domain-containing protein, partial [Isosphaeraceae bacterium]|nr:HEAT repeat domain-containing protein [Isosphaeraceae bacterium]